MKIVRGCMYQYFDGNRSLCIGICRARRSIYIFLCFTSKLYRKLGVGGKMQKREVIK